MKIDVKSQSSKKPDNREILSEIDRLGHKNPELQPKKKSATSAIKPENEKKMTAKKKKQSKTAKGLIYAGVGASVLGVLSLGLLTFRMVTSGLLSSKILQIAFLIVALVVLAILAATAYQALSKRAKTPLRVFLTCLSLLCTALCIFAYLNIGNVISFLKRVVNNDMSETESYSVAVLKESEFEEIGDLATKRIGFGLANLHLEQTKSELGEVVEYEAQDFEDVDVMLEELAESNLEAVVLSANYLEMLEDENAETFESLRIIYTFEVAIEVEAEETEVVDTKSEPFVVYISGSDARGKLSSVARSDVNMLVVVNPNTNKILLVSVPRDYYVQLHGTTGRKDKLTHAGVYGLEMSRKTMEDIFDLKIDHTVKVGFKAVENIVNAIDGIDIYSDKNLTTHTDKSCHFTTGTQHVNGACALAFARERYAYSEGDRHRIQNQQAVLTAIFNKIITPKYLANYSRILDAMEDSFVTSFTYEEITGFATGQLDSMKGWNIESISVDGAGSMQPTYSMGAQPLSVVIPDWSTVETAKQKIAEVMSEE